MRTLAPYNSTTSLIPVGSVITERGEKTAGRVGQGSTGRDNYTYFVVYYCNVIVIGVIM